jgi:hypothetical protein
MPVVGKAANRITWNHFFVPRVRDSPGKLKLAAWAS